MRLIVSGSDCRIARQMPKLSKANTLNIDNALNTEKTLPKLKELPIESTLPTLAMLNMLPVLPIDRMLPTLAIDKILPMLAKLRTLPRLLNCFIFAASPSHSRLSYPNLPHLTAISKQIRINILCGLLILR